MTEMQNNDDPIFQVVIGQSNIVLREIQESRMFMSTLNSIGNMAVDILLQKDKICEVTKEKHLQLTEELIADIAKQMLNGLHRCEQRIKETLGLVLHEVTSVLYQQFFNHLNDSIRKKCMDCYMKKSSHISSDDEYKYVSQLYAWCKFFTIIVAEQDCINIWLHSRSRF